MRFHWQNFGSEPAHQSRSNHCSFQIYHGLNCLWILPVWISWAWESQRISFGFFRVFAKLTHVYWARDVQNFQSVGRGEQSQQALRQRGQDDDDLYHLLPTSIASSNIALHQESSLLVPYRWMDGWRKEEEEKFFVSRWVRSFIGRSAKEWRWLPRVENGRHWNHTQFLRVKGMTWDLNVDRGLVLVLSHGIDLASKSLFWHALLNFFHTLVHLASVRIWKEMSIWDENANQTNSLIHSWKWRAAILVPPDQLSLLKI